MVIASVMADTLISSLVYLILAVAIIFAVCWAVCWVLQNFAPAMPAQVQSFVWLVGALIAIIKICLWAGL
jgi:hypothetical protein